MSVPGAIIQAARRAILQQFPDMDGMSLTGMPAPVAGKYIVTAEKAVGTADGRSLRRIVRVTVDEDGTVLKISASK
jgi:hypothetical protein